MFGIHPKRKSRNLESNTDTSGVDECFWDGVVADGAFDKELD